jgi:hypothetical protein
LEVTKGGLGEWYEGYKQREGMKELMGSTSRF